MNNDLISREALRNVILNDRKLDGANANWEVNRILVHIDKAPTVPLPDFKEGYKQAIIDGKTNFSRPQGEWKEVQKGIIVTEYKCPFCGRTVKDDTGYDVSADFPFCHCGADMRNEKITVYQTQMEVVEKDQPLSNSDEISKAMEKAKEK